MQLININEIKDLRDDIMLYAEMLEKQTYHPYLEVQNFAKRLTEIINNIEQYNERL